MMPLVTIITINYNGLKDTCELLETLPLGDETLEVIVVDNASREDEGAVIRERFPQVKVIRSDRNLGFAGGNNLGIREARGKYLFFINNDTLLPLTPQPSAITHQTSAIKHQPSDISHQPSHITHQTSPFSPLIQRLESDERIGAVCPKIRFTWGGRPIQYAGYTPLSAVTLRNRSIGFGEDDRGQYDVAHPTPYAHGAAMMVKREAIDKAGVMPECYFLYYEELDWSLMLRRAGYDIWYEPAYTVFHKESQSTGQESPLRTYYITRNRLLFVRRNCPRRTRWLSYLYLVGIVAVKDVAKQLLHGRTDLARATIKGIVRTEN